MQTAESQPTKTKPENLRTSVKAEAEVSESAQKPYNQSQPQNTKVTSSPAKMKSKKLNPIQSARLTNQRILQSMKEKGKQYVPIQDRVPAIMQQK